MALHLYFTGCLLLLTWSYGTTVAHPVRPDPSRQCASSAPLFKSLLVNLSGLIQNSDSFHGMHLNKLVTLETSPSETELACAPVLTTARCQALRKESFSESECLNNILKDLVYYEGIISSYIKLNLWKPDVEIPPFEQTLNITHSLLHAFSVTPTEKTSVIWKTDTFSNRQNMLRMMRAFYIRAITFNRAVGYIASGDHKNSSSS